MDQETIGRELQKFNITDAAIAKLNADCMALTVQDASDDNGYKVIKTARMDIVRLRGKVEKTRVALKAESLEYGRRIDGEAKRITALLEPIETYLIGQEKIVDDEKARIKAEADAKEAARIQARIDTICAFAPWFDGQMYEAYGLQIPMAHVRTSSDEEFAQFIGQVQEKKDAEENARKIERARELAEAERFAQAAAWQEAERQRLAEIAQKQTEEAERLNAEQKKLDDAKQKVGDDARRAQEMEVVRVEAAEKAKHEAEEAFQREITKRGEKERKAKEAAEKKAARAPDKNKLKVYLGDVFGIPAPEMKTPEGLAAWKEIDAALEELNVKLVSIVEAL